MPQTLPPPPDRLLHQVAQALRARRWLLATAESCTGGLVGAWLTSLPGSSAWYLGGVVAYANRLKVDLLGVDPEMLAAHGAVSRLAVEAMAQGARQRLGADVALAISGVAGPDGGTPVNPVGSVWLAWATREQSRSQHVPLAGHRQEIRRLAATAALEGVLEILAGPS